MKLRANAKTPGECCWSVCKKPATRIYEDENYKYLACSQAHAEIVAVRITSLSEETRLVLWGK